MAPWNRWPSPWNLGSEEASRAWMCGAAFSNRVGSSCFERAISTATACRPMHRTSRSPAERRPAGARPPRSPPDSDRASDGTGDGPRSSGRPEGRTSPAAQDLLKDPLELDLDGLDQGIDTAGLPRCHPASIEAPRARWVCSMSWLSRDTRPAARSGAATRSLTWARKLLTWPSSLGGVFLGLDLDGLEPHPGQLVDGGGIGRQRDRAGLCRRPRHAPCRRRSPGPAWP